MAVGASSLVLRTQALTVCRPSARSDPRSWGIDVSLQLWARDWRVAADERDAPAPSISETADWWHPLLERWGGLLTTRVLGDLAAGGGDWCTRGLRVAMGRRLAAGTNRDVPAAGWEIADDPATADLDLDVDDEGNTTVGVRWPGVVLPTRIEGAQLAEAVRRSLAAPTVALCIGARDQDTGRRGGDFPLAEALGGQLARLGIHVVVRPVEDDRGPWARPPRSGSSCEGVPARGLDRNSST